MKKVLLILGAIIGGLIAYLIFGNTKTTDNKPIKIEFVDSNPIPISEIDSIPDTNSVIKVIPRDSLVLRDSTIINYDTLTTYDTIPIYYDYFKKRTYVFSLDTLGLSLSLEEIVWANALQKRTLLIDLNQPISDKRQWHFLGGGGIGNNNAHLGGGLDFEKFIIIYNRNFLNEQSKNTVSYYHKF